jgi:CRISPR-associated exonuclease Cas4
VLTAEGHVLHAAADLPGRRKVRGLRRVSALPIASRRLGIAGVADLVEFQPVDGRDVPFPIEIKHGKPKRHHADEVQLCAQGLCLEEMTGVPVPAGALYYAETRRRQEVALDAGLRALTEATVAELRRIFTTLETPPPTPHKSRCRACSLNELCRPTSFARPVLAWRRRMVEAALADPDRTPP